MKEGKVPAVYHGADTSTAHSDFESVPVDAIVRAARVYILSAFKYLSRA